MWGLVACVQHQEPAVGHLQNLRYQGGGAVRGVGLVGQYAQCVESTSLVRVRCARNQPTPFPPLKVSLESSPCSGSSLAPRLMESFSVFSIPSLGFISPGVHLVCNVRHECSWSARPYVRALPSVATKSIPQPRALGSRTKPCCFGAPWPLWAALKDTDQLHVAAHTLRRASGVHSMTCHSLIVAHR